MKLNFPGRLQLNEIIGRLLGPDMYNAYSVAVDAEWDSRKNVTQVKVRPVAPAELKTPNVVVDKWGQPWLTKVMSK